MVCPVEAPGTRRAEALVVSNDLLSDIELGRLRAADLARRTSRLARLLDDPEAMEWLAYEVSGYPTPLTEDAARAAKRSNRGGTEGYVTASLAALEASAQATELQLQQPPTAPANLGIDNQQRAERSGLRKGLWESRGVIEKIVGSFHEYASQRNLELRFGSAAESAFEVVRAEVDSAIGRVVPKALPKLSSAFENAVSDNSEDWAAAAATCRRLLKAVADALQPPGEDVESSGGRTIKMGRWELHQSPHGLGFSAIQ